MKVRRTAVLALVLAAVLSACGGHSGSHEDSIVAGRDGDIAFAQMMIPHHEQAVEMADLALERQTSPEVQELAQQIKDAQDPEIEQMTGWLTQWGATTSDEDHSGMAGMVSDADLSALADAQGAAFDEKWIALMIAHHEGALTMAQKVIGTTDEASVRTLAEAIVAGQTAEIAEMKALLAG